MTPTKEDILIKKGLLTELGTLAPQFSEAMDDYAKKIAIGFIHYTEWKMEDDDWLDKEGKLKSLDQVYLEYIKQLSV